jgi:hypothetical protein
VALAVVQHKTANNGIASTTLLITVTSTGTGNLLVAHGLSFDGTTPHNISGVSDGTNNFTQFPSAAIVGSGANFTGIDSDWWYLPASSSGKTTITITWSGSVTFREGEVWEVSGFTTPATDGTANNTSAGGTASGTDATGPTLNTTGNPEFVAAAIGVGNSVSANPKAGNEFTAGGNDPGSGTAGDAWCSLITTTTGNHTPVWSVTTSGDVFITSMVGFKETPVASPHLARNTYMAPILTQ